MSMSMEIDNPSDAPEMEDFVPGRNGMFTFDVSPEEDLTMKTMKTMRTWRSPKPLP